MGFGVMIISDHYSWYFVTDINAMERLSDLDWLEDIRIAKIHNKDEKTHVHTKWKKGEFFFKKKIYIECVKNIWVNDNPRALYGRKNILTIFIVSILRTNKNSLQQWWKFDHQ